MPALKANVTQIISDFARFSFASEDAFYWDAQTETVHYNPDELENPQGIYRLLHEIGHAVSDHRNFESGIKLLTLEVEAWEKAVEIGKNYNIHIPEDHIESCIDTYRDWLHKRSTCPSCQAVAIEYAANAYRCFNCLQKWQVSGNQLLRCYRRAT